MPAHFRSIGDNIPYFGSQFRRSPLVGIDKEDPITFNLGQCRISLLGIILETRLKNGRSCSFG